MLHTYSPTPAQKAQHEAHKARIARMGGYANPSPEVGPEPEPEVVTLQYRLVAHFRPKTVFGHPLIHSIITEVAEHHGVTPMDIISSRRQSKLVTARHEAMWRARNETPHSLLRIAMAFRRDHTTVMHGIAKHEERISNGSSAGDIETDGRGNIAKPTPVRINVGAINIPDIRINNGHRA